MAEKASIPRCLLLQAGSVGSWRQVLLDSILTVRPLLDTSISQLLQHVRPLVQSQA
jgi:hypothetical protein